MYVHLKKHDKADKRGDSSDWSEKEITYHCPMEKCDKKYNTKSKLRAHILKHFPDTLKPEDAAQIDIIPLLHEGIGAKETVVEPSTVSVKSKLKCFNKSNTKLFMSKCTTKCLKNKKALNIKQKF